MYVRYDCADVRIVQPTDNSVCVNRVPQCEICTPFDGLGQCSCRVGRFLASDGVTCKEAPPGQDVRLVVQGALPSAVTTQGGPSIQDYATAQINLAFGLKGKALCC